MTLCIVLIAVVATRAHAQPVPAITAILNNVSTDSLLQHVKEITGDVPVVINGIADTIKTRLFNSAGNEKAALFIKEKMLGYGLTVDSQVYNGAGGKNILARMPGTTSPNKIVILSAHYDNVGPGVSQGADDNGSGLAALIEAARVCKGSPQPFTLLFAFWDEEEIGLIGSGAYANAFLGSGQELVGCINLDQIGWDGNGDNKAEIYAQSIAGSLPLAGRAQTVNTLYNIGLDLQLITTNSGSSDHNSFWNKSLTAIALLESFYTDPSPHRHLYTDTVETLNMPYLTRMAKLAIGTALHTARLSVGKDLFTAAGVTAYPSPFRDQLTLRAAGDRGPEEYTGLVMDITGRVLAQAILKSGETKVLDTSAWPTGMYTIVLKDSRGGAAGVQKVVK